MRDLPGAFDRLLAELEPSVRAAFIEAINRIRTTAQLYEIEAFLERGDIEGLLDALNLSPDYFRSVQDAVDNVFYSGAQFQVSLAASVSSIPFNRRHLQAEAWARENGSRLIVEISEATRDGVRQIITTGLAEGRSSGKLARQIVGTKNRATGQRESGILGLTSQQAAFAENARKELLGLDAAYFRRKDRDRRYDPTVRKAIKTGKPIPQAEINKIIRRYADILLVRRGAVIAQTESHQALNAGRYEAMRQTAENAGVPVTAITAKWQASRDGRTRDTHMALRGKKVSYGKAFVSPSGAQMKFPGDRSLGAPAGETINCRCTLTFELDIAR